MIIPVLHKFIRIQSRAAALNKGLPKCPENNASRQFLISGIHLYNNSSGGILRKSRIAMNNITSLQGVMPNSGE